MCVHTRAQQASIRRWRLQALQEFCRANNYRLVKVVDEKPQKQLHLDTCQGVQDISTVQLEDGARVAVVATYPTEELVKLYAAIDSLSEQVDGFAQSYEAQKLNEAAAWAFSLIKDEPGAHVLCQKMFGEPPRELHLPAGAVSSKSLVIVAWHPVLTCRDTQVFINILADLHKLQDPLLSGKIVHPFLYSARWTDKTNEQAAIRQLMVANSIKPLFPGAARVQQGWGCYPPCADDEQAAKVYEQSVSRQKVVPADLVAQRMEF